MLWGARDNQGIKHEPVGQGRPVCVGWTSFNFRCHFSVPPVLFLLRCASLPCRHLFLHEESKRR